MRTKQNEQIRNALVKKKRKEKQVIYMPTGCDLLDLVVGAGQGEGYPSGKIINAVGDKSSGKTFLACEVIAACKNKFGNKLKWIYDDCESGFSFDTERLYGFEIMPKKVEERTKSESVEEAYCNIRKFAEGLSKEQFGIYIVDSLDGLTSEESDELADERFKAFKSNAKFKKGSYKMGKAKYLSQEFFPQLADLIEKKNMLLIIISQVRDNIDPMSFDRYARAGGKAMDFFCHTVLWLANVHRLKRKGRAVGVTIKAKTTKSKTPRPYREVFINLLFDYGIDNISTNVDFLYDFLTNTGLLGKNCNAQWEGKECNLRNLKQFLIDNKIEDYYRQNVFKKLKVDEVVEWLSNNENIRLKNKYAKEFCAQMSRDDLIQFIYENKLEETLKRKVVEKWEMIETSVRTNRLPKYAKR